MVSTETIAEPVMVLIEMEEGALDEREEDEATPTDGCEFVGGG